MDDELFDWLKATSTSARSVSYIRQNSHSFARLPSVTSFSTKNSRNLNLSKIGPSFRPAVEEIKAPSDKDWEVLMRRNKQAQEERGTNKSTTT